MRIFASVFVILILTYLVNASVLDPVIENVVHRTASKPPDSVPGIWKKKTIWKPRWVKEWKSAKVMKPVWRKVWSPVQIREWMPIPKPPPGWDSKSTPLIPIPIHPKPQKVLKQIKDSIGHGSYTVHTAKIPLWDPVPYPESQQPPPVSFPQPVHNPCGKGGCDTSPSFSHQQISEIIGPRYQTPDYNQNPEFSETVNHLTRLPPDGVDTWRPPQPLPDFRFDNFQQLPEFLIPPKFQSVPQIVPERTRPWIPLPPENKIKGHFITKPEDQPYKFQIPEVDGKNVSKPVKIHSGKNGDFIQEAQLVSEYHYSTFDLPDVKLQPNVDEKVKQQEVTAQTHKPNNQVHKPKVDNKQTADHKQTQTHTVPHIQKKHIANPNHFLQQEVILQEVHSKSVPTNTLLLDHSTTRLQPVVQVTTSTSKTPVFIPPNHKQSVEEIKHPNETNTTPEKNNKLQIVFATTPTDYNQSTENLHKSTTTTEPYEIIFSSSLQATTESVTRSPIIIVTPANSKENA